MTSKLAKSTQLTKFPNRRHYFSLFLSNLSIISIFQLFQLSTSVDSVDLWTNVFVNFRLLSKFVKWHFLRIQTLLLDSNFRRHCDMTKLTDLTCCCWSWCWRVPLFEFLFPVDDDMANRTRFPNCESLDFEEKRLNSSSTDNLFISKTQRWGTKLLFCSDSFLANLTNFLSGFLL